MIWTVGLAALALGGGEARAQSSAAQRVVVDSFGGPQGGTTRAALVRSLEENGLVVIPSDEVDAARRQLGLGARMTSAQYVEIGRALRASAFIDGRVSRQRRRWSVTVRVRSASDGEIVGRESWGGRTVASLGAVRRTGYRRLEDHLAATSALPSAQVAPSGREVPWYARGQDDEAPPEEEEETPASSAPSQRYDSLRFSLRLGTLYRWMDTMVRVYAAQRGLPTSDPANDLREEDRAFRAPAPGHFELGGQVELYPGAFGDQPFPYIGVLVAFSHSIAAGAVAPHRTNRGVDVSVPTNQLDFLVGLRGRYRFGPERREPEIHFDVGWGTFNFDLGLAELQQIDPSLVIPPMQHGYVQLGAGIRYGIVPTYLTASLELAYRIGTNIGPDTRNVWGTETAPSNGLVVGIELKSEIPEIAQGVFVGLLFQYFQLTTAFRGQVGCVQPGACSGPVDPGPWADTRLWEVWPVAVPSGGEPYDINRVVGGPIGDVNDNYIRLQLSLGYAFQ